LGVPYATAADGHDALPSVAAVEQKLMNYTDRSRQVLSWGVKKRTRFPGEEVWTAIHSATEGSDVNDKIRNWANSFGKQAA